MTEEQLWREFAALPSESQKEVLDFIAFLRIRSLPPRLSRTAEIGGLGEEPFVGMWKDHQAMDDSTAWVRRLRRRQWNDLP
jgi:hypothetical protein